MSHIVAHCPYEKLKERAEWNQCRVKAESSYLVSPFLRLPRCDLIHIVPLCSSSRVLHAQKMTAQSYDTSALTRHWECRREVVLEKNREGNLIEGLFWMYTISMFVFWVPILGGLAAGVIGGWVVGRVKGALKISIVPAVIFSVVLTVLAVTFQGQWLSLEHPFLSPVILVPSYVVFLIIGAFLGGLHQKLHVV